jgi:hypothetical protein
MEMAWEHCHPTAISTTRALFLTSKYYSPVEVAGTAGERTYSGVGEENVQMMVE